MLNHNFFHFFFLISTVVLTTTIEYNEIQQLNYKIIELLSQFFYLIIIKFHSI
jgi:hypothetical protein